ncbi:hypothetical protein MKQ70_05020 [Chitinophaga sedimenti]|uniref:hypothetical protein n=1 Tax=Chitinophaga sedimenti TaxID=2033606 RepID=UPI00200456F2|nr:hypothetical protein [Chitinophaga sedimenti]MCK7554399.1 hypothetical protein [Chitinophaga sedimenti]
MNANGGSRAFMFSTANVSGTNPYPTLGTVKVFVRPGETINVGSSAQNVGNGYIVLRAPNGTTYTTQGLGNVGKILNRSQEVAGPFILLLNLGGYTPATYTVGANQGGIWEIDFLPPNQASTTQPTAISASAAWTQPSTSYIAAWDVSVRNTAGTARVNGRTFMNVFTGSLGNFNQPFNAVFNILTRDGYRYTVNNNGQTGYGFSFFVNNKGVQTAAGAPSYKSFNDLSGFNMQDPATKTPKPTILQKSFLTRLMKLCLLQLPRVQAVRGSLLRLPVLWRQTIPSTVRKVRPMCPGPIPPAVISDLLPMWLPILRLILT